MNTPTTTTANALAFNASIAADNAGAAAANAEAAGHGNPRKVATQAAARAAAHAAESVALIADLMVEATPSEMLEVTEALERAASFSAQATRHAADAAARRVAC